MRPDRYDDPHEVEDILTRASEDTRRFAAAAREAAGQEGIGAAADDLVRVAAVDGRVAQVRLDPRAMRLPSEDLATAFAQAANAALDDLASKYPASGLPAIDPGPGGADAHGRRPDRCSPSSPYA